MRNDPVAGRRLRRRLATTAGGVAVIAALAGCGGGAGSLAQALAGATSSPPSAQADSPDPGSSSGGGAAAAKPDLTPISLAGYSYGPVPTRTRRTLAALVRKHPEVWTGAEGHSVFRGKRYVGIMYVYGVTQRMQSGALVMTGFMHGLDPEGTAARWGLDGAEVRELDRYQGRPVDVYVWMVGGVITSMDGIDALATDRRESRRFVRAYIAAQAKRVHRA